MHGLRERSSAVLDDRREHLLGGKRVICLTLLYRFLRRNTRYGQDRTLCRLHDRLVRRIYALAQRKRQIAAVRRLGLAQFFRHAAEQQRQDNARVAARAAQQRRSRRIRRLCKRRLAQLRQLVHRRRHGHRHVRARIAVRHRENVQLVDLFLLFGNGECALGHHGLKQRTVDFRICHLKNSPKFPFRVFYRARARSFRTVLLFSACLRHGCSRRKRLHSLRPRRSGARHGSEPR